MSFCTTSYRLSIVQRGLLVLLLLWVGALNAHLAPREVTFIDTGVADWQVLRDGMKPGMDVVLLDAHRDGLAQMAAWAATHSGYDAIHVLSHGAAGQVQLGTLTLNSTTAGARQTDLAMLGGALNAGGDLLLYGCNVATGHAGVEFVNRLAQATGADVGASSDLTGAAALGGNWTLEDTTRTVDMPLVLTEGIRETYGHLLASADLTSTGQPVLNGGGGSIFTLRSDTPTVGIYTDYAEIFQTNQNPTQNYYIIQNFDPSTDKFDLRFWGETNANMVSYISIANNTLGNFSLLNSYHNSVMVGNGYRYLNQYSENVVVNQNRELYYGGTADIAILYRSWNS